MKPAKILLISLLATSLAGCSTTMGKFNVFHRDTPAPVPITRPAPMTLGEVEWKVYDVEGLKKLIVQLEASGDKNVVLYVMDKESYEVLAMNLAEMKRYIADQDAESTQLRKANEINAGVKK